MAKGIISSVKGRIQHYFDERAEQQEQQDKLDKEVRDEERRLYAQEYRKNALEAARLRARREALEKSGLAKLRAVNDIHNLKNNKPRKGFLQDLSEYTKANLKRREENLRKTEEMRKAAMEQRQRRIASAPLRQSSTLRTQRGRLY